MEIPSNPLTLKALNPLTLKALNLLFPNRNWALRPSSSKSRLDNTRIYAILNPVDANGAVA